MLAQPFTKKTLIVVLILAAALITLGFAVTSAPAASVSADRSYDAIEQIRVADPQASVSAAQSAPDDFYQRHPNWTWTSNETNAVVHVTGESTYLDYAQRHPELLAPAPSIDYSDYFLRHPELSGQ